MEPVSLQLAYYGSSFTACFVAFMYRYQVSVACSVAMETLDPHLCGIAIKRAVQRLSESLVDDLSEQEDQLMKDVLKLLQLMYSKVGLVGEWW